ncbi:hypothetical protein [Nostoc sp.]|uniref:hypothetical protein n=1 Tax=Nostoc sp. TaxID=1180 RepID=UPI002FF740D5
MTNQTFTNGYALLIGVGADLPVTVKDATAIRDILIDGDRIHQMRKDHTNPNLATLPHHFPFTHLSTSYRV